MAICISDSSNVSYDGNLATANGFYDAEAWNMGMFNPAGLALSTTRTINVTFAHTGNAQGIILCIGYNSTTATTAIDRSVTVTLQEYIASVWTTIATKTLTYNEITNSSTYCMGWWIIPFTGGTFPVVVDTDVSTYRFQIVQSGGTKGTWLLKTSDGTNPFYVTWCDNARSFSSTNDALVVKDAVTIDQTCNFKGVLGTADAIRSVAVVVCRSTTPTPDNVALLKCLTPAAAYTMTLNGICVLGAHSGFRLGTSSVPIPVATPFTITHQVVPTLGTAATSGFTNPNGITTSLSGYTYRPSFFLYGAIPTVERTTLNGDIAVGASQLTTVDTTGWAINDTFFVGKCDNITGAYDRTVYTITGITAKVIDFSPVVVTPKRLSGGMVCRTNGYGIVWQTDTFATEVYSFFPGASNLTVSGVQIKTVRMYNYYSSDQPSITYEDTANSSAHLITHCSYHPIASSSSRGPLIVGNVTEKGLTISYVNAACNIAQTMIKLSAPEQTAGTFTVTYCWVYATNAGGIGSTGGIAGLKWIITYNKFETHGSATYGAMMINSTDPEVNNNTFYGCLVGIDFFTTTRGLFQNNTYNRCGVAIRGYGLGGGTKETVFKNETFGNVTANTMDVGFQIGANVDIRLENPSNSTNVDTSGVNTGISGTLLGSRFCIKDYATLTNDDRNWYTYGYINRTGDGLGDTIVRTSGTGKFALRFQPTDSTNKLTWLQYVPTGNIQNKTMNVNVWVKMNNAAYYAGTHTNPTLRVTYDNGTEITAVATDSTSWQQLNCSFTPTTTYGQISVQLEGATDATTTNAYFYVDDMNIAYPAGVTIDLGGLDIWANGLPVTPAIATMPSLAGVWDEATTAHVTAGSFGKLAIDTEIKADDAAVLRGVN